MATCKHSWRVEIKKSFLIFNATVLGIHFFNLSKNRNTDLLGWEKKKFFHKIRLKKQNIYFNTAHPK